MVYSATITSNDNAIRLHQDKDLNSPILLSIPNNEYVIVLEDFKDWSKIFYNNNIGFVMKQYLRGNSNSISISKIQLNQLITELENILNSLKVLLK